MALVVPEGFLFRKDTANVRKFLLSKARLQSVISLPQGTFLPYTGVKTDILYFTDAHRPNNQKNYWFFEAKNIGVTLDNHKRKIKGNNDLKKIESSDIKKPDKTLDLQDNMLEIGFEIIDLEKVENNGYNLVGNVYRDNNSKANFVLVKLQQIAVIESGNSAPQESSLFEGGTYPFFRVSDVAKEHLSTNLISTRDKLNNKGAKGLKLFSKNSILFPKSGASTLLNHRAIMGCDGYVASHLAVIQPDENKVLCEYLYYILSSIDAKDISLNDGYPSIRIQRLQDINIPLPSLGEQQKIVKSIQQKEKEIQMLKDKIKENKQFINQEINKIWQLEEEIKPVADKSVFDALIKQASRPF
jgi:type I restriction enzyme M protein